GDAHRPGGPRQRDRSLRRESTQDRHDGAAGECAVEPIIQALHPISFDIAVVISAKRGCRRRNAGRSARAFNAVIDTEANTAPVASRIGIAMQLMYLSYSPASTATPWSRTSWSSRAKLEAEVIVAPVYRVKEYPASIVSTCCAGRYAIIALLTPAVCRTTGWP